MTPRKTTQPAAPNGTNETGQPVTTAAAATVAADIADVIDRETVKKSALTVTGIRAIGRDYKEALSAIRQTEIASQQSRREQLPAVVRMIDSLDALAAYWRPNTPKPLKSVMEEEAPEIIGKPNPGAVALSNLVSAGQSVSTASNTIRLARRPDLVMAVADGLSLPVAYRLASIKDLSPADIVAARAAQLDAASVSAWTAAHLAAKAAIGQWPVYTAAIHSPDGADSAAAAWKIIKTAADYIAASNFPSALSDLDERIASLIDKESAARAKLATAGNDKARAEAAARDVAAAAARQKAEEAAAVATSAAESARAAIAVTSAAQSKVDEIRQRMETAGNTAAAAMRDQLAAAQRDLEAARKEAEKVQQEAEKARQEAETTAGRADATTAAAQLAAARVAGIAESPAPVAPPRPTAPDVESLAAVYKAMSTESLKADLAIMVAESVKRNDMWKYVFNWRALELELVETLAD